MLLRRHHHLRPLLQWQERQRRHHQLRSLLEGKWEQLQQLAPKFAKQTASGLGPAAVPTPPSAYGGAVDCDSTQQPRPQVVVASTLTKTAAAAAAYGGCDGRPNCSGAVGAGSDSRRGWLHPAATVVLPLQHCAPQPAAAV